MYVMECSKIVGRRPLIYILIDEENGNHLWFDTIKDEMKNVRPAFEVYDGEIKKLVKDKSYLIQVLSNGTKRAEFLAKKNIEEVYKIIGLTKFT